MVAVLTAETRELRGEAWHGPALRELHATATTLGVSDTEQAEWLTTYRALKTGRAQPTDVEQTVAQLRQEHGANVRRAAREFHGAFQRLPRTVQEANEAVYLTADPMFLRGLVKASDPLLRASEELDRIYQARHTRGTMRVTLTTRKPQRGYVNCMWSCTTSGGFSMPTVW